MKIIERASEQFLAFKRDLLLLTDLISKILYYFILSQGQQGERNENKMDNKDPIIDVPEYRFLVTERNGKTSDNRYIYITHFATPSFRFGFGISPNI